MSRGTNWSNRYPPPRGSVVAAWLSNLVPAGCPRFQWGIRVVFGSITTDGSNGRWIWRCSPSWLKTRSLINTRRKEGILHFFESQTSWPGGLAWFRCSMYLPRQRGQRQTAEDHDRATSASRFVPTFDWRETKHNLFQHFHPVVVPLERNDWLA